MHKLRWDDLQIILAIADHGSVNAAARHLGLNHSTLLRRVASFEARHGVMLFEKRASGYVPTAAGEAVLTTARQIDASITTVERQIVGHDERLAGRVTLTTTDTYVCSVLAPHLASFHQQHSKIVVELVMTNARLELTKLAADLAVRPSRDPPEALIGRKVSGIAFAVYGPAEKTSEEADVDITRRNWIGVSGALLNAPVGAWMRENVPPAAIVALGDSFVALRELVAAQVGIAALPCSLGDTDRRLKRVLEPIDDLATALWVLAHRDIRNAARVRALSDHLYTALRRDRHLLEGIRDA